MIIKAAAGAANGIYSGGEGGTSTIDLRILKNIEYTLLGVAGNSAIYIYRGSQLMAAVGQGGEGDYAISKNLGEDETDEIEQDSEVIESDVSEVEVVDDFSEDVEEIEEFKQATDSIPEKKISVSIEQLRKKMGDDKEN